MTYMRDEDKANIEQLRLTEQELRASGVEEAAANVHRAAEELSVLRSITKGPSRASLDA